MRSPSSYRPFTPGYTGFVPAAGESVELQRFPRAAAPTETSTAGTYRRLDTPPNESAFVRTGALSRAVTIYTPHNPHNVYHPRFHPLPPLAAPARLGLTALRAHGDRRLSL